jgi:hypothetical protein
MTTEYATSHAARAGARESLEYARRHGLKKVYGRLDRATGQRMFSATPVASPRPSASSGIQLARLRVISAQLAFERERRLAELEREVGRA